MTIKITIEGDGQTVGEELRALCANLASVVATGNANATVTFGASETGADVSAEASFTEEDTGGEEPAVDAEVAPEIQSAAADLNYAGETPVIAGVLVAFGAYPNLTRDELFAEFKGSKITQARIRAGVKAALDDGLLQSEGRRAPNELTDKGKAFLAQFGDDVIMGDVSGMIEAVKGFVPGDPLSRDENTGAPPETPDADDTPEEETGEPVDELGEDAPVTRDTVNEIVKTAVASIGLPATRKVFEQFSAQNITQLKEDRYADFVKAMSHEIAIREAKSLEE